MSFKSTNYLSIPSFAVQGAMLLVVVGVIMRIVVQTRTELLGTANRALTFMTVMSILIPLMTFFGHVYRTRLLYAFAIYLMFLLFPIQATIANVTVKSHYVFYDRLSLGSNILVMLGLLVSMAPVFEVRRWKFNPIQAIPIYNTCFLYFISAIIVSVKNKDAANGALLLLVSCAAFIGVMKRSLSIVLAVFFYSLHILLNSMSSLLLLPPGNDSVAMRACYALQFVGAGIWICWYSFEFLRKNIEDILIGDADDKGKYTPLP